MRETLKIFVLGFFLLVISCQNGRQTMSLLEEAEHLMVQAPDSALLLLESVESPETLSEENYAYWCLLITQARDKNYIEQASDTLIQEAIDYYRDRKDVNKKMKAYYYKAVILHDLGDALQAQDYYLKALEAGKESDDYALLGRICGNLGTLYSLTNVEESALYFQHKAFEYFKNINDSVNQSFALRNIGRIYSVQNQTDSAINYCKLALAYAEKNVISSIYNDIGLLFRKKREYDMAQYFLDLSIENMTAIDDTSSIYLNLGILYQSMEQKKAAYHFFNLSKNSPNLYTSASSYHHLAQLEEYEDWDSYLKYHNYYEELRDSIEAIAQADVLAQMQSLYNYQVIEEEKAFFEKESHRKTLYAYNLYLFIIGLIAIGVGVYIVECNKRKNQKEQYDKERRIREQQYRQSLEYLDNKEKTIDRLEELLSSGKKELDYAQKQLLVAQRKILEAELFREKIALSKSQQEEDFYQSVFYTRLFDEKTKMQEKDWEEIIAWIDVIYFDFTYRIKVLYPAISDIEMKICYLNKLKIPVGQIASLLNMTSQAVSIARKRLYTKLTGKQGGAKEFDRLISDL